MALNIDGTPKRFCGMCARVRQFNIEKEPCGSCYFFKDKNGKRTKLNYKPQKKQRKEQNEF
jgi:ribosomal protein L37E